MATEFEAGIAQTYCVAKGALTLTPGELNPDLDITFYCNHQNQGIGFAYAIVEGDRPFAAFTTTATAYAIASGTMVIGSVYDGTATAYAFAEGEILLEGLKKNWVQWSNIGSLDFTIGKDNIAGERPLDWAGWIYETKKLIDKVIVYGENGVSILFPSGNTFGLNTIHRIGLKGKHAVTGDDNSHFFINNKGYLYSLGESLEKLDYSEYLSIMTNPVMSYDEENELVYICDGTYGYVYSPRDSSLGTGPINLTGLTSQDGTLYVAASGTISTPLYNICTDIYDMGTRKLKTIFSLEFGVDLSTPLFASIDYRDNKSKSFAQTPWYYVDESGFVRITCSAREFRIRSKTKSYSYFEKDYIKINGEVLEH